MDNAFDYVFPVIGYEKNAADHFDMRQIYGTAFSIGEDLYLTAGHSLTEASQHEAAALGRMAGGLIGANQIREREILTDSDLAVCQADVPAEKPLAWQTDELGMLTSVRAIG